MSYLEKIEKIKDPEIKQAVTLAIEENLLPALTNAYYFGHFSVTSNGEYFDNRFTWPGLDAWEIAGAYLLLGKIPEVIGYFDFVQASQRMDGNIPFAIVPPEVFADPIARANGCLRGLNYPADIYSYSVPENPYKEYESRQWIGAFNHWVKENPLSLLGSISYLLIAYEIYLTTKDINWLKAKMDSLERAGQYILTQKSISGLLKGAGFYIELPPRYNHDGITQCYGYNVFCNMAALYGILGNTEKEKFWKSEANSLKAAFISCFWKTDKFAEYIHPENGAVDWHGYTDVDFAAIGFGLADSYHIQILWDHLKKEKKFWWGDMPTQIVTKSYNYREWELGTPVPFPLPLGPLYDISAIGRVWYVELQACLRMGDVSRLVESVKLVAKMGLQHGGKWFERYHPIQNSKVVPCGPGGYCEYPAILTRIVLGNLDLFI